MIAHHLGVSERTAVRWANDPDFPLVRGSKGATVYASRSDLDRWIASRAAAPASVVPAAASPAPALAPDQPSGLRRWLRYAAPAALVIAAGGTATWFLSRAPDASTRSATDPATRAAYLDARAQWATRTPQGIDNAIRRFQAIILRDPDFAPAFSGLADAYVLTSEFVGRDRRTSFAAAEKAARTALALAPDDPSANRVLGFLTYWTTRDFGRAQPYFDRALAKDDKDYLIHLWYGNVLVDALAVDRGLEQIDRAAELAPDVPAVLVDRAVAQWQAGQSSTALAALTDAERRYPDISTPANFLALFALSRGQADAYLTHAERWAARIAERGQIDRIARERAAFTAGGASALWRFMAKQPPIQSSSWHGGYLTIAIAASLIEDRPRLQAVLDLPDIRSQNWRPLRFPVDAFRRWKGDPVIAAKLDRAFGLSPFDAHAD